MGIAGLLPLIKPICQQSHVTKLANKRVGIDVYGWLHKGIFSCASKVCRGIDTTAYVDYCMHRVRMLMHFKVIPVLVFDGADLPMKADTHAERKARRDDARVKADAAYAAGDLRRAEEFYQRACAVTSDMARLVIRECRKLNVEYVVAPYEADAQLAWLLARGHIAAVITEDSDLLPYGAHTVFYKMTRSGDGDLFDRSRLPSLDTISLSNFTDDMFIFMCVCAGCDFFKGVPGLGLRKSQPIVKRMRTLSRLIVALRGKYRNLSPTFAADFTRAYLVFRHQTVYDVESKTTVSLTELSEVVRAGLPHGALSTLPDGSLDLSFLGRLHTPEIAEKVATGQVHPRTLQEYEEPLDTIPRTPTPRRPRSFHFPSPTLSNASPAEETRTPQSASGFSVQPASQPASSTQNSSYTLTPNLRSRLFTSGQTTFNPRQAARQFNRSNSVASRTRNPRLSAPGSLGVWSKFRPASTIRRSDTSPEDNANGPTEERAAVIRHESNQQGGNGLSSPSREIESVTPSFASAERSAENEHGNGSSAATPNPSEQSGEVDADVGCSSADATQVVIDDPLTIDNDKTPATQPTRRVESKDDVSEGDDTEAGTQMRKSGGREDEDAYLEVGEDPSDFRLVYSNDESPSKRTRKNGTSSNRVEALNRVVGKFAKPERDQRLKFVPKANPARRPPSPDREAYDMFEKLDNELSRDCKEGRETEQRVDGATASGSKAKLLTRPRQTGLSRKALVKKSPTSQTNQAKGKKSGSGQLLVSRFFASSADKTTINKPNSSRMVKAPGLKRKRSVPSSSTDVAKKPKPSALSSLDRYRRNSSSKKAASSDGNR